MTIVRTDRGRFTWIIRVFLALVLGTVATWIVAWVMTVIPSTAYYFEWTATGWYTGPDGKRIDVHFEAVQGPGRYDGSRFSIGNGTSYERMCKVFRERSLPHHISERHYNKFGFPFHALGYRSTGVHSRSPGKELQYDCEFENLIEISPKKLGLPWQAPGGGSYRFPTRIHWPGFMANTLCFAAVLFPILYGPRIVRRWIRCKRGLCLKCGYDLTGNVSGVCPECGEKIPTKSAGHMPPQVG